MVRSHSPRITAYATPRTRRHSGLSHRHFVAFLLVASFGILFAGCSTPPEEDVFTFTEEDVVRFRELAGSSATGTGAAVATGPRLEGQGQGQADSLPALDLSMAKAYDAVRAGPAATGEELYRVTNAYLNVRAEPRITAAEVDRLSQGDVVMVLDFLDAAWAKVKLVSGSEGYVATRYISKIVSEENLAEERKKYEGVFFVDFGFLNVRKSPDAGSEKLGELPGQSLVRPISQDRVWARIPFDGQEGYVAVQYLSPFAPSFLVRQETYRLPILHYRLAQGEDALTMLASHVARLKQEGVTLWTLRDLRQLVLTQEERDARVPPKTAVLLVSDVTSQNVQAVSDTLQRVGASATLFIQTSQLGLSGITERTVLSLIANGFDVQSGGHTGDDLRSLTNAQMDLELTQSRVLLEQMTGRTVFAMGYPMGGVNERVMQQAVAAGYLFGVGSAPERSFSRSQFLRLPSFLITGSMTVEDVVQIVTGQEAALRDGRVAPHSPLAVDRSMIHRSGRTFRARGWFLAFV
jgi:peptidoglycan/xylan/chitin deacetylase (PgdA/CDA1 family)